MEELKPCPFCGHIPETKVEVTYYGGGESHIDFSIRCTECGTSKTIRLKERGDCRFFDVDRAESEAVAAWNRREEDGRT